MIQKKTIIVFYSIYYNCCDEFPLSVAFSVSSSTFDRNVVTFPIWCFSKPPKELKIVIDLKLSLYFIVNNTFYKRIRILKNIIQY